MSLKKKLGMGIASAALGLALVAGGTFAYFSDTAEADGVFAAGKLDLAVDPTVVINVENIKPGDVMVRPFQLENNGTLDISKVDISTKYKIDDAKGDNTDDFGKHIKVLFLNNADKTGDAWLFDPNNVISQTTLYDLQKQTPDAVENVQHWVTWFFDQNGEGSGLEAGTSDQMYVAFQFVDNGENQNQFQQDALELEWTFTAHQTPGELR